MKRPVVIWGLGQMGGAFAHALLRAGHPIHPVTRATDPAELAELAASVPDPALCLLAVGENDLAGVWSQVPAPWRGSIGLLQNELLPGVWQGLGVEDPTVAVVWFEKKKTVPITPVQSTPVGGPAASMLVSALEGLGVPAHEVSRQALRDELVKKNLYILTANATSMSAEVACDVTMEQLLSAHRPLVEGVARDALAIQASLTGEVLPETLLTGLYESFLADPHHRARGRSAAARLSRALAYADAEGLEVPALRAL